MISGAAPARVKIEGTAIVLGRGEEADLRLDADGVSRRHARIVRVPDGLFNVLDVGSTNGTYVNGRRIDVAVLRHGDEIQIGQVIMRFAYELDQSLETVPPRVATPLAARLTPRELEIARLVAQGLTNPEIGKRLHISPRTVSTHLANIYERLGIHNRAALASTFVEYDLGTDSKH